ncbi:MAG: HAMP domain-containing histidine kinase [Lachnospiraceae bacterium]|nr:HAMP domain-containing histidine kinase [Lachnospiraceae bacterium]
MDKVRNLSVRKTILLYMAVALFCSFLLSAVTVRIATRTQMQIWWNYVDEEAYFKAVENKGPDYVVDIPRPSEYEMTQADYFVSELCDFLETYTILILSMAGSCAAVFLFYQNKLQKPIEELALASKKIADNHLDFNITYENKDEMGALCMEFERMRGQLAENNQILWKNIEEEKMLRAAIAHDIRSPLSVLKGYQEMLIEYLPSADIDMEQAMEMLSESRHQIERMDTFVETMRKMSSLEKREMVVEEISARQLEADIRAELVILEKEYGKQYILQVPASNEIFCGDKEIILEVTENLMSNAFRYAKHQVEIMVRVGYSELGIYVRDDGHGFKEDAEKIVEAFHGQNVKDSLKHAGIGMYISRLYCEKHGGKLVLENDEQGGAVVTAIFRRIA